jgi:hypothetical protein
MPVRHLPPPPEAAEQASRCQPYGYGRGSWHRPRPSGHRK